MNDFFVSENKNLIYVCYTELDRKSKRTLIRLHINNVIMWRIRSLNNGYLDTTPMIQSISYFSTMIEPIDEIKKRYNNIKDPGLLHEVELYYIEPNTLISSILSLPDIKSVINTFMGYEVAYEIEVYRNNEEVAFQS